MELIFACYFGINNSILKRLFKKKRKKLSSNLNTIINFLDKKYVKYNLFISLLFISDLNLGD